MGAPRNTRRLGAVLFVLVLSQSSLRAQAVSGTSELTGTLPAHEALERHPGINVTYGDATVSAGYRVRTVRTRPTSAVGPQPTIFVVGWLSCDGVTYPTGAPDGYARLVSDLVEQSGLMVYRVEKPGVGDSEGPPCRDADFEADLEAYRAGWRSMLADPGVDTTRVVVLGLSNGAAVSPMVSGGARPAAFVSVGAWATTWLEHMLGLERRRMALAGTPPWAATDSMPGYETFYDRYLNGALTPEAVSVEIPQLRGYWHDAPEHQYGRPAAFYHQLQRLNIARAWSTVQAPVLVLWGEYDWIMSREDGESMVSLVAPGARAASRFVVVPGADHGLNEFDSEVDAFRGRGGRPGTRAFPIVRDWIRARVCAGSGQDGNARCAAPEEDR
jgi:pimeloyl-ACP methyl ester carboxylesterase